MRYRWRVVLSLAACLLGFLPAVAQDGPVSVSEGYDLAAPSERCDILLLGDSTVIGSVPRKILPEADHLEGIVRKLLDAEGDLPPIRVIDEGKDGDWVRQLLDARLEGILQAYPDVDIVSFRYGLNDRGKREGFDTHFVSDLKELNDRLKTAYPNAIIFIETVIVYFEDQPSHEINDRIRQAAVEAGIRLIDQYAWTASVRAEGNTSLTYHRIPVEEVPEKLRGLLPEPWNPGDICVLDNSLDIHFREVPRYFADKHPNLAGYHVIATELARNFAAALRETDLQPAAQP